MSRLPSMTRKSNKQLGITVLVPQDWLTQQLGETVLQIYAPYEEGVQESPARISYTKTFDDDPSPDWLERLMQEAEDRQRSVYPGYQILKEEDLEIDGHPAFVRQIQWEPAGEDATQVHLQAAVQPQPGTIYIIKAATPKGFAPQNIRVFMAIISSTVFRA